MDHEADNQHLRDSLPRIRRTIKEYGSTFSERAQAIVHSLQSHTDLDCRFLGVRLSFSDFYKSKKEQQAQQQQRS
jgi:gamma-tubulin complex component 3